MILPTARWYRVAAGLAVLAPLALRWPAAAVLLFVADLLWVLAFVVDAWRNGEIDLAEFPVTKTRFPDSSAAGPAPDIQTVSRTKVAGGLGSLLLS